MGKATAGDIEDSLYRFLGARSVNVYMQFWNWDCAHIRYYVWVRFGLEYLLHLDGHLTPGSYLVKFRIPECSFDDAPMFVEQLRRRRRLFRELSEEQVLEHVSEFFGDVVRRRFEEDEQAQEWLKRYMGLTKDSAGS